MVDSTAFPQKVRGGGTAGHRPSASRWWAEGPPHSCELRGRFPSLGLVPPRDSGKTSGVCVSHGLMCFDSLRVASLPPVQDQDTRGSSGLWVRSLWVVPIQPGFGSGVSWAIRWLRCQQGLLALFAELLGTCESPSAMSSLDLTFFCAILGRCLRKCMV